MLSSKKFKFLEPYIKIIEKNKNKTIEEIRNNINKTSNIKISNKGRTGNIIENLLGLKNNNSKKADLEEIKTEIKVLPLQLHNLKVKEPTQIKMINYMNLLYETWETTELREKIETIFWVVYGVPRDSTTKKNLSQEKYILLDWFIDVPNVETQKVFKKDFEEIKNYVINGKAEKLSCSMGKYIEPKTKGKNNKDKVDAPNGKGGVLKARRRAYYFKKNYTNEKVIKELDIKKN